MRTATDCDCDMRSREIKSGDFRDLPLSRKPPLLRANHVAVNNLLGLEMDVNYILDILAIFYEKK